MGILGTQGKEHACIYRRHETCSIPKLEEKMAIHSNILAWIIPQIEEPLVGYIP